MPGKKPAWQDPSLWEDRVAQFRTYNDRGIRDAIKFSAWYSGDLSTLGTRVAELAGTTTDRLAPLSNHVNINTQSALSELFFRNPTFVSRPQPQFGPMFGEKRARIETRGLNDWVDESDFFGEMRKTILDGLLTPMMIFEVGYTADIGIDNELMDAERAHAQVENEMMLKGGRPTMGKKDHHPCHIEEHDRFIAAAELGAERGGIDVPASVLRYAKKHRKFHEDACTEDGSRPLETARQESVFGERVSMLCWAGDPGAGVAARRRWVGKWFLRPISDVKENKRYDATARSNVKPADLTSIGGKAMEKALRISGSDEIEDMALLFEGVDLQHGKVVVFSQGANEMLTTTDYRDIRIRPAGPYITSHFMWDPVKECGVAPPRIYEGHQEMVCYLDTLIAIVARRSVPQMAGVGNYLSQAEIDKILSGIPANFIHLKKVPPGADLKSIIQRIPAPEATQFLFEARMLHERACERYSGIGSARSGGGDFSKTATASAIVNDSVTNLSEDRRAILDDFMCRVARDVTRLQRRRYSVGKMMEVAGLEAADPDGWTPLSERDIVRDKGVTVIPGSSRRKDSAVDLKLNIELLSVFAKMAWMPPTVLMDLSKRALSSAGQYEVSGLDQAAQMAEIERLLGGAGGMAESGGPMKTGSNGEGRTNPERRAAERGEGTQAAVQQGAQNVGGGRAGRNP